MKLSVSHLKEHITCPAFAHFRNVLRVGPASRALALDVGTAWHLTMQRLHHPTAPADIFSVEQELEEAVHTGAMSGDAFSTWQEILRPVALVWSPPPEWSVVTVEQEYSVPLGKHTLVGRPDAVVKWNGTYWHLQHKTVAASVPLGVYGELQRTDWHECAYQKMLEAAGYSPVTGTILVCCRKFVKSRIQANPLAAIDIQYLARSTEVVEQAFLDMWEGACGIALEGVGGRIIRHPNACGGAYRNSLCPYRGVCFDGKSLADMGFINIPDRYSSSEAILKGTEELHGP